MSIVPIRVEFAADVFIAQMRRQWTIHNPGVPAEMCPVKPIEEYPAAHKVALLKAVEKAVLAMEDGANEIYSDWLKRRIEEGMKKAN